MATLRAAALVTLTALIAPARARAAPAHSSAGERVIGVLAHIAATLRVTTYRHTLHVDERAGRYDFDCSAMASWILGRAAPRALATVGGNRPLAVDFLNAILRAPIGRRRGGWERIEHVADAQPGDVIAWRRPPWFSSRNTGHVAFVVGTPETFPGGYLVRIADASSYNHEDDTRNGSTGFGFGTLLITADPSSGAPTGYGWAGRYSGDWVIPTTLAIGRPTD